MPHFPRMSSFPLVRVQQTCRPTKCHAHFYLAEREGFEPSKSFPLHTFQACSFDRSDTSPKLALPATFRILKAIGNCN